MKYIIIAFIAGFLFVVPFKAKAETLNVLLYCKAIDLTTASTEDKELFLEGLVEDNIVATSIWQGATLSQKYSFALDSSSVGTAAINSILNAIIPQNIQDTSAWQNASIQKRYVYALQNGYMKSSYISNYMINKNLVPLLKSILTNKYDVLVDYFEIPTPAFPNKHFFHCLMDRNGKLAQVKDWIDNYNIGKADADKILYWYGDTVQQSYTNLWTDGNAFAQEIAIRVLRYPAFYHLLPPGVIVTSTFREAKLNKQWQYGIDNGYFTDAQPKLGTVKEAQDNGITIHAPTLKIHGVPIRPFEG